MEWLQMLSALTATLCAIAMVSAVLEALLAGRRGSEIVCLMLTLAGIGAMLSVLVEFI